MSDIRIHDVSARARARLGRTYQVNALAPYPPRPALDLWQLNRRTFVHPGADLGAGFGFGADSNLLRRLKMGIAAEGLDQTGLDTLTNADVTTDRRGVTVRPAAAARLSAATREAITKPERPPKMQNWFFEKRPAQRIARQLAGAEATDYEDTGASDVETLRLAAEGVHSVVKTAVIPPPVRITHIYVSVLLVVSPSNAFEWSITPPGLADGDVGDAVNGAVSVFDNGTSLSQACDVPVLYTPVQLRAFLFSVTAASALSTILISVAYRRLRRKSI